MQYFRRICANIGKSILFHVLTCNTKSETTSVFKIILFHSPTCKTIQVRVNSTRIYLNYISALRDNFGNEYADELARIGSNLYLNYIFALRDNFGNENADELVRIGSALIANAGLFHMQLIRYRKENRNNTRF